MNDQLQKQGYSEKAADRGEPSYVWRDGQRRRMGMIETAAGERMRGILLEDGCGVGSYLNRMARQAAFSVGLEIEFERGQTAFTKADPSRTAVVNSPGEALPFANDLFDLVLSHEVIEHVEDDRICVAEIVRCLKPGGRLVLFCPNRGYPFETHGVYWKGEYHFGNKFLVNYLPRRWRDRLAPHVNVYTAGDLEKLFSGLPVKFINRTIIFGAYDNIIGRTGIFGKMLRGLLQGLEKTPLKIFGLSHFWVVEKTGL